MMKNAGWSQTFGNDCRINLDSFLLLQNTMHAPFYMSLLLDWFALNHEVFERL